jgi:hypothetical protein
LEENITSIISGSKRNPSKKPAEVGSKLSLPIDSASFLLGLLFYLEGGQAQVFPFFFPP